MIVVNARRQTKPNQILQHDLDAVPVRREYREDEAVVVERLAQMLVDEHFGGSLEGARVAGADGVRNLSDSTWK